MSSIDWSKAPEGTTGARVAHFHHPKGYGAVEFLPAAGERDRFSEHSQAWVYVPRPAQWNGEGMPPVGTVCEMRFLGGSKWSQVEVIAHFLNGAGRVAAFIPTDGGDKRVNQAIAECFRPIRTAEQIAAEEREKEAEKLFETVHPDIKWHKASIDCRNRFRSAIDAGYRKQVQP